MLIFLVVGLGITAAGIYAVIHGRRNSASAAHARKYWTSTRATVLELVAHDERHSDRHPTSQPWWHPVVEFTLGDGRTVRGESTTGARPAPAKVGDVVPILYDPTNPENLVVDRGLARPGMTGIWLNLLGVMMILIGVMAVAIWALLVFGMKVPI